MSYALNQRVAACGHQAVSIASGATGGAVTVSYAGVAKATDTILVTLDINGSTDLAVTMPPYIFSVTDAANFIVDLNGVDNAGVGTETCFLNYKKFRIYCYYPGI